MNEKPSEDQGLEGLITSAMTDGITVGLMAFIKKHHIKTDAGTLDDNPCKEFIIRLSCEINGADRVYPFSKSFKDNWLAVIAQIAPVVTLLWLSDDKVNAESLARTVAYMETIKFLEDIRIEAVSEFNKIRGDDKPDFSAPPHG